MVVGAQAVTQAGREANSSQLACRLAVCWETDREDPLPCRKTVRFSLPSRPCLLVLGWGRWDNGPEKPENWGWEASRELRVGQPSS